MPVSESVTVPVIVAVVSFSMKFWVVTAPDTTATETPLIARAPTSGRAGLEHAA